MTDNDKLIQIIEAKDVAALKAWLENGGNPNLRIANSHMRAAEPDCAGEPLLTWVVRQVDEPEDDAPLVEMINLLIQYKADVNAGKNNDSALYWIIGNNRSVMAKMLLEAEANANFRTDDGYTPLIIAMENECWEMVAILLPYSNIEAINRWGGIWCNTPLGMAFRTLNVPMIELLLSYGADPDAYDPDLQLTINNLPYVRDDVTREKIEALIEKYKKD